MVLGLGFEVAEWSAEQGRVPGPGCMLGIRVGTPEVVIAEQPPDLLIADDEPRGIADRRTDPMDRAACLEGAKSRRCLQEVRLMQGQLDLVRHCSLRIRAQMYSFK